MTTITTFFLFIGKAFLYGIGLAFGFFVVGKATGYIDYYFHLYMSDRERFWNEINDGIFAPPRPSTIKDIQVPVAVNNVAASTTACH